MELFGFGSSGDYLSVDFGASAIKVARANISGRDSVKLNLVDSEPLHDVSSDEYIGESADALDRIVDRNSVSRSSDVILALPANEVIIRRLELPSMPEERMSKVIGYEAESHIPFPLDQVVMDHYIISQSEDGVELILAAIKEDNLEKHLNVIQQAELSPGIVDVSAFSFFNLYQFMQSGDRSEDPVPRALVDVGHGNTDIMVFKGETLFFARSASVAGESLDEAIVKKLDVDVDRARELKHQYGHVPLEEGEAEETESGMDALSELAEERKQEATEEETTADEIETEEQTEPESAEAPAPPGDEGLELGMPGESGGEEAESETDEEPPASPGEEDAGGLGLGQAREPESEESGSTDTAESEEGESTETPSAPAPPEPDSESDEPEAPPAPPDEEEEPPAPPEPEAEAEAPEPEKEDKKQSRAEEEKKTDASEDEAKDEEEDISLGMVRDPSSEPDENEPGGDESPAEVPEEESAEESSDEEALDLDEGMLDEGDGEEELMGPEPEAESPEAEDSNTGQESDSDDDLDLDSGMLGGANEDSDEDEGGGLLSAEPDEEEDEEDESLDLGAAEADPEPEEGPENEELAREVGSAIRPKIERLIGELRHTFDYFQSELGGDEIDEILISGGSSKLKNLPEFIGDQLGYSVSRLDAAGTVQGVEPDNLPEYLVSGGLQLRSRPELATLDFNLVPEDIVQRKRARTKNKKLSLVGVLAGLFVLLLSAGAYLVYSNRATKFQASQQMLDKLNPIVEQVNELEADEESIRNRLDIINSLQAQRARILPLLQELNTFPGPEDPSGLRGRTWFKNFSYSKGQPNGTLNISGVTGSYEDVSKIFSWMEQRSFIIQQESENMDTTEFKIGEKTRTMVSFSARYSVKFGE